MEADPGVRPRTTALRHQGRGWHGMGSPEVQPLQVARGGPCAVHPQVISRAPQDLGPQSRGVWAGTERREPERAFWLELQPYHGAQFSEAEAEDRLDRKPCPRQGAWTVCHAGDVGCRGAAGGVGRARLAVSPRVCPQPRPGLPPLRGGPVSLGRLHQRLRTRRQT